MVDCRGQPDILVTAAELHFAAQLHDVAFDIEIDELR